MPRPKKSPVKKDKRTLRIELLNRHQAAALARANAKLAAARAVIDHLLQEEWIDLAEDFDEPTAGE